MKEFACGDVMPGCDAKFRFATEEEILQAVGVHAREDHGISEVPNEVVEQVRSAIRVVA
ncbi:MAG: DUF1059 domain-containing protein [Dehalococcoidia bacterium]|nr:DUF1059 domain-containing protein [Dehalococcoidia bacterium]